MSKGKYCIKILSKTDIGFDYQLYVKPVVLVKKAVKNIKMTSCDIKEFSPKLGKGVWTTTNKNVLAIISKKPKSNSVCKVRAKKTGKAVLIYKNKNGSVIKYNVTVKANSTYPFDRASCEMDSVGGLKPSILISNNSDKKIKYVYITVSFYNSVGDKVLNDIGGYANAKLKITGYIEPWNFKWFDWDPVFYNTSASKIKIESMTVEYSNGSKITKRINKKYAVK